VSRKHTRTEIAASVAEADALAADGNSQSEIAHTLGVSVMTLHRWRKMERNADLAAGADENGRSAELRLENSRLRKLVADLLLDTMKLKEEAQSNRHHATRKA
jgi:putative transposase